MFGFGGASSGGAAGFTRKYRAYSAAALKPELEDTGKIILPPSALESLSRLRISYPMLFKLTSASSGASTHAGVLEFIAEEGRMYLPYWMMNNIAAGEGSIIEVTNLSLPKAKFAAFKPEGKEFMELSNPKVILENILRTFSTLTKGDRLRLPYNGKLYFLTVETLKPSDAVCIIETDMEVDFVVDIPPPPAGQGTSTSGGISGFGAGGGELDGGLLFGEDAGDGTSGADDDDDDDGEDSEEEDKFVAFGGSGNRLDGKGSSPLPAGSRAVPAPPKGPSGSFAMSPGSFGRSPANFGGMVFKGTPTSPPQVPAPPAGGTPASVKSNASSSRRRSSKQDDDDEDEEESGGFKAFSGKSYSLK